MKSFLADITGVKDPDNIAITNKQLLESVNSKSMITMDVASLILSKVKSKIHALIDNLGNDEMITDYIENQYKSKLDESISFFNNLLMHYSDGSVSADSFVTEYNLDTVVEIEDHVKNVLSKTINVKEHTELSAVLRRILDRDVMDKAVLLIAFKKIINILSNAMNDFGSITKSTANALEIVDKKIKKQLDLIK